MKILVALIALAAAGAAGVYGWNQKQAHERTAAELSETRADLARASGELGKAREMLKQVAAELQQSQAAAEKLRGERDAAASFLQQEKAYGERLRAELTLAQQQLAFVRGRQSPASAPPTAIMRPQQPMVIRAVPAPRPQGATSAVQAQPPRQ